MTTFILKIKNNEIGFFGAPIPTTEAALEMCGYSIGKEEELIKDGEYTGLYLDEVEFRPATDEELAD